MCLSGLRSKIEWVKVDYSGAMWVNFLYDMYVCYKKSGNKWIM